MTGCNRCGNRLKFIRDRGFRDGSGLVYMCENEFCDLWRLYVYPDPDGAAEGVNKLAPPLAKKGLNEH